MDRILDLDENSFDLLVSQVQGNEQAKPTIEARDPAPVDGNLLSLSPTGFDATGVSQIKDLEDDEPVAVTPKNKPEAAPAVEPSSEPAPTPEPVVEEEPEEVDEEELAQQVAQRTRIFSASAEYMINAGIWSDWEGREEEEWTDERWAEELESQAELKVEEKYLQIKQSNQVLSTIFEYIEEGGDPAKAIDLFNRQRDVAQTYDLATDDGKKAYILDYYTKIVGENKLRAERILDAEITAGGLDPFFDEVKEKYDAHFQKEQTTLLEKQKEENEIIAKRKLELQNGVIAELRALNMDKKTGNELANYALTPMHNVNGKDVTPLEVAYMKAQRDPKMLVKLAQFLKDPNAYDEAISIRKTNKVIDKGFDFLKGTKAKSTEVRAEEPKKTKVSTKPLQINI